MPSVAISNAQKWEIAPQPLHREIEASMTANVPPITSNVPEYGQLTVLYAVATVESIRYTCLDHNGSNMCTVPRATSETVDATHGASQ